MSKISDVPQIRFKGFTDAWVQHKLGEAINVKSGKDYKHLDNGDVPVYGTGGYMLSVSEALEYSRDAIGIGRKGTIDKPFVLKAPFWTVDTLFYCIPEGDNALSFLYPFFQLINWKLYDESTGVPSLSKTAIEGVTINLTSEDEQISIGEFFERVDNLITLHQGKYNQVINFKKAMLEKMFPKNGSDTPEIRFKEFSDENIAPWIKKNLKDESIEIIAGGDINTSLLKNKGKYPVVANALTRNGIVGYYDDFFRVKAPAVTVTGRGDVGHAKARLVDFTPVVRLISIKSNHNVLFLENSINTLNIVVESTGVPQLTVPQLSKYDLYFPPTINEEEVVGDFFNKIDILISSYQCKLQKLKNIKKALLEKMFV